MMKCALISRSTGKMKEFESISGAAIWLGRCYDYVLKHIKGDMRVSHRETKETFNVVTDRKMLPNPEESTAMNEHGIHPNAQPCGYCKNAIGGCEWSRCFKPVPGWRAIPTEIERDKNKPLNSYKILFCPKFERG